MSIIYITENEGKNILDIVCKIDFFVLSSRYEKNNNNDKTQHAFFNETRFILKRRTSTTYSERHQLTSGSPRGRPAGIPTKGPDAPEHLTPRKGSITCVQSHIFHQLMGKIISNLKSDKYENLSCSRRRPLRHNGQNSVLQSGRPLLRS